MSLYETLDEDNLLEFLTIFYGRIRQHPELGPIFNKYVGNEDEHWRQHIALIATFWNAIFLKTKRFTGNPMRAHMAITELKKVHFDMWLELFHRTALETFEQQVAEQFIMMSNRIGSSLKMGIEVHRGCPLK